MIVAYDRSMAVAYAKQWALSRNPAYLDFETLGGDCTNFVSQCLYAGSGVMNAAPVYGWYYHSATDRSAAWTSARYLYRFLTTNQGNGPIARETTAREMRAGDVIQLANAHQELSHTVLVAAVTPSDLLVAAHSQDAWMKPLSAYPQSIRRFLHIQGVGVF